MRNIAILSVDIAAKRDIDTAWTIINEIGEMFGGILLPAWALFRSHIELACEKGASIWINSGAVYPSHLCYEVSSFLSAFFPSSMMPEEKGLSPGGIIMPCYPHLIKHTIAAFRLGLREYKSNYIHHLVPSDWQPPLYPIAALTYEDRDERVLQRAEIAKSHDLPGVIAPCDLVSSIQTMELKAIVTAIRDPERYPVQDDHQVIVCTPKQARDSNADFFILGSSVTQQFRRTGNLDILKGSAEYFLNGLGQST